MPILGVLSLLLQGKTMIQRILQTKTIVRFLPTTKASTSYDFDSHREELYGESTEQKTVPQELTKILVP